MKAVIFSSEVFPFAKTGGLADVTGALPLGLEEVGLEVKVFMPLYKNIKPQAINEEFGVSKIGKNIEVIFIRNDDYYLRDYLYNTPSGDYPDNLERFSFFCRKSLEVLKKIEFQPQILHCNDWQTALIPLYLEVLKNNEPFFRNSKTLLTIHNLAYQGIFPLDKFKLLNLPQDYQEVLEIYSQLNFLKAGIVKADWVNTVSPTYSQEIQAKEYGCGLENILRENNFKLSGILNAIDYNVWEPSKDNYIYFKYDPGSLRKKIENKLSFQKDFSLKVDKEVFLLGMVSRLAEQKGIDILSEALPELLSNYQVVILGTGEERYHQQLSSLAENFPQSFSLHLKFDESLAHKIYASVDAFLMPSRFEPCGLSQMISFKYATIPIVRAIGGLKDTVIDYSQDKEKGCGFVFYEYDSSSLIEAIDRAFKLFSQDRKSWQNIQKRISSLDFSWSKTAKDYLNLYNSLVASD